MAQPQIQQNVQWTQGQQHVNNNLALKGTKVRMGTGTALIVTGVLEIIMASVVVGVPLDQYSCDNGDRIGWGIWGGVVSLRHQHFCKVIMIHACTYEQVWYSSTDWFSPHKNILSSFLNV